MGDYSGPGGGISPPAGDIGGTTADPTVVSTHLTSPLPVAQGGTGNADIYSTANTWSADQTITAAIELVSGTTHTGLIEPTGTSGSLGSRWTLGLTDDWELLFNSPASLNYAVLGLTGSANPGSPWFVISANGSGVNTNNFIEFMNDSGSVVFQVDGNGVATKTGTNTTAPVYTTADVVSGTALQISTTRDAIVSLDITYSTTSANTILVQTGPTSTPANTVFKKVKTTSTAEEDTIMVDVKAGEYLLVTLTNATFTNATQVVKLV